MVTAEIAATVAIAAASPTPDQLVTVEAHPIVRGAVYVYTAELPAGCKGGRYRVVDFLIDVPSYQPKILVQCLSGKDAGLRFTTTQINFVRRYKREEA